jgi:dimethylamine/trimethylamine dehydrogenase
VRFAMDELAGPDGVTKSEAEEVIGRMGEVPDLWDLTMGSWDIDSRTSRFAEEAAEEEYVAA